MIRSFHPGRCAPLASALLLAVLTGCSGNSVKGTVTFDGAPVDGGVISFIPQVAAGAQTPLRPTGGSIAGGKYSLEGRRAPLPGKYRVEIVWNKKTGREIPVPSDPGTTTAETTPVIPPAYNRQSTLEADVTSGANTFDFDLKSR